MPPVVVAATVTVACVIDSMARVVPALNPVPVTVVGATAYGELPEGKVTRTLPLEGIAVCGTKVTVAAVVDPATAVPRVTRAFVIVPAFAAPGSATRPRNAAMTAARSGTHQRWGRFRFFDSACAPLGATSDGIAFTPRRTRGYVHPGRSVNGP